MHYILWKWLSNSVAFQPCRPPTNHLPTTNQPPTDHLPTTYQPPNDHLTTTYRPPTNHLLTTYWPPTIHLLTTYQPPTDHQPTTYWPPTDWPPTDHQPSTYQPPTDWPPTDLFYSAACSIFRRQDVFVDRNTPYPFHQNLVDKKNEIETHVFVWLVLQRQDRGYPTRSTQLFGVFHGFP